MALFAKHEPDLGELAAYIVDAGRGRGVTITRARLVKLLYLVDVERVRGGREPLTGVEWSYEHNGPSAPELDRTLKQHETREKDSATWGRSIAKDTTRGDDWVPSTKMLVGGIVRDYAGLDFNALLDHVYFKTGPMADAVRGQPLQLGRARDDPRPRRARALETGPVPDDLADRLARWRASTGAHFVPRDDTALEPPAPLPRVAGDASDSDQAARIRLQIPEPTQL